MDETDDEGCRCGSAGTEPVVSQDRTGDTEEEEEEQGLLAVLVVAATAVITARITSGRTAFLPDDGGRSLLLLLAITAESSDVAEEAGDGSPPLPSFDFEVRAEPPPLLPPVPPPRLLVLPLLPLLPLLSLGVMVGEPPLMPLTALTLGALVTGVAGASGAAETPPPAAGADAGIGFPFPAGTGEEVVEPLIPAAFSGAVLPLLLAVDEARGVTVTVPPRGAEEEVVAPVDGAGALDGEGVFSGFVGAGCFDAAPFVIAALDREDTPSVISVSPFPSELLPLSLPV